MGAEQSRNGLQRLAPRGIHAALVAASTPPTALASSWMRATAELKAKVSSASVTAAMQRCVACRSRRAAPGRLRRARRIRRGSLDASPATSR